MTVKELYEWAKENNALNLQIEVLEESLVATRYTVAEYPHIAESNVYNRDKDNNRLVIVFD